MKGSARQFSSTARQRATSYLERNLPKIIADPYTLALTTQALALAKSAVADVAYGRLLSSAREEGGMVYWGRKHIETNKYYLYLD